jgi:lipoprotein-releasing system permease protein
VYASPNTPAGWQAPLTQVIRKNPEVQGVAPYMSSQSIILHQGDMLGVKVEGIDPTQESEVSDVGKKLIAGRLTDLTDDGFNIVIGVELARTLGLETAPNQFALGQSVTLLAPEANVTVAGMLPRMREFNVVGILNSGHFEIDNSYAYIHVNDATRLFHEGNQGLRVKIKDMDQAQTVGMQIEAAAERAGINALARDWTSINPAWFSAVKTEKTMMTIILLIITVVAGFNLVSMLVMTVNEKQADIAILRTQGASRRSIMKIFMIQGALIGGMGTLIGVGLGILVAANIGSIVAGIESAFGLVLLPKGVYFINRMPSEIRWQEVVLIAVVSFGLSLLATIYPSRKAAAVEPARALRYE